MALIRADLSRVASPTASWPPGPRRPAPISRARYTILTAAAGVCGRFAGSTTDLAFLTPFLSYDATKAYVTLARNDLQFAAVAQTRNQASVASAAQAKAVGSRLYAAIAVLSGEIHSSTVTAEFATASLVWEAILDRLRFGTGEGTSCAGSIGQDPRSQLGLGASNLGQACASVPTHHTADLPGRAPRLGTVPAQIREPSTVAVWGQGFGAFGSVSGNGNAGRLGQQNSGFVLSRLSGGGKPLLRPREARGAVDPSKMLAGGAHRGRLPFGLRRVDDPQDGGHRALQAPFGVEKVVSVASPHGAVPVPRRLPGRRSVGTGLGRKRAAWP